MKRGRKAAGRSARRGAAYSAPRIAARIAALGKLISRQYRGRRLDVVVTLDRSFVFAADLLRQINVPVVCHFVHEDVRDVNLGGRARREVFFGSRPELKGRDVLVVDAVLESGVRSSFCAGWARAVRGQSGWRCCWTSRRSAAWPWSPITLASGLHLT